jgi:precorrin-4/cobalt-precorrin-4 C11-methyltransferase
MSGMHPERGGSDASGSVAFIGAGPGAPGLLTLDAVEALRAADLVLYADSLVSPEIARFLRPGVPFEGTKERHLDAIAARMIAATRAGQRVARVHSGDPALYGAITEQIALLRQADVPYRIIPGVSSVFAAAAALGVELTVPDVAQTIIMTRAAGRTGMPQGETLRALAAHGTTLAILLGITRIRQLVADLLAGGYTADTPAAALYRVSWPDEAIVRGTLADLATSVKAAGWSRQALILVGRAIDPALQDGAHRSHLYAPTYSHRIRRADAGRRGASVERNTRRPGRACRHAAERRVIERRPVAGSGGADEGWHGARGPAGRGARRDAVRAGAFRRGRGHPL